MFLKALSMVLAFFMLTQSINLHVMDIVNLGALVEHIELHESEYGDNLFSFISKHYGNKISEHQEHKEQQNGGHHNLPFKHAVYADSGQFFLIAPDLVKWMVSTEIKHQQPTFYYNNYSYLKNSEIFQPPRIG